MYPGAIDELFTVEDFVNATRGEGPLAATWKRDPAQIVARLAERVKLAAFELEATQKALDEASAERKACRARLCAANDQMGELYALVQVRNSEIEALRAQLEAK